MIFAVPFVSKSPFIGQNRFSGHSSTLVTPADVYPARGDEWDVPMADGATIVLITDGSPSACSGGRIPADHTKQMAQQLHDSGVRFACIIVNDPGSEALSLYPSPITAVVNTMDDLRNVQVILDSLK